MLVFVCAHMFCLLLLYLLVTSLYGIIVKDKVLYGWN